jgi:hypothetical protein
LAIARRVGASQCVSILEVLVRHTRHTHDARHVDVCATEMLAERMAIYPPPPPPPPPPLQVAEKARERLEASLYNDNDDNVDDGKCSLCLPSLFSFLTNRIARIEKKQKNDSDDEQQRDAGAAHTDHVGQLGRIVVDDFVVVELVSPAVRRQQV